MCTNSCGDGGTITRMCCAPILTKSNFFQTSFNFVSLSVGADGMNDSPFYLSNVLVRDVILFTAVDLDLDKSQSKIRYDSAYKNVYNHHTSTVADFVSVVTKYFRLVITRSDKTGSILLKLFRSASQDKVVVFVDGEANVSVLHITDLVKELLIEKKGDGKSEEM